MGHIPQFAYKQSVTLSVTHMATVTFVVDQKVIYEFSVPHSSAAVGQIAVSYGGDHDFVVGPSFADAKGLFTIELFQFPVSASNFQFTSVQDAIQKRFLSISDRLYFASFAHNLSSTMSPLVLKQSGNELSLIQVCYVLICSIYFYLSHFILSSLFSLSSNSSFDCLFSAVCGQIVF